MRVPLLVLLSAVQVLAQALPVPEVRGTIVETGTTTPIAGVEVFLTEFAPNADNFIISKTVVSTYTDVQGTFSLKPGHFGQFSVGAKKPSYMEKGRQLNLSATEPIQTVLVSLIRPAAITGRVIDRDGNPAGNFRVRIDEAPFEYPGGIFAVTNAEGIFTASNLTPGSYLVALQPATPSDAEDLAEFNENAFKIVDEDVEPSYWPGGVTDPRQVLPINAAGGSIANAGTITIRKSAYYRVRVTLNRDCLPNERWTFRILHVDVSDVVFRDRYTACRKDALLSGIPPGSYELAIWSGRKADRWALVPFVVTDRNTQVNLMLNDAPAVAGRVLGSDGADLSKLGNPRILIRPTPGLPPGEPYAELDPKKEFTFDRVPWKTQWITVDGIDTSAYVKEIRYNGLPLRSHQFDSIAGAALEIVLDSGAAKLVVTLKQSEKVTAGRVLLVPTYVTEPPSTLPPFPPFSFWGGAPDPTPFVISSLPPGEYRVLVLPFRLDEDFTDSGETVRRFVQAPKITLGRGELKRIELEVK